MLGRTTDFARPLRGEEATLNMLPLGQAILASVQEVRPYGIFVALAVCRESVTGTPISEDSLIRGFCSQEELRSAGHNRSPTKGSQVVAKLLRVDDNQRLHVRIDSEKMVVAKPQANPFALHSPMQRMNRLKTIRDSRASDPEADRLLGDN